MEMVRTETSVNISGEEHRADGKILEYHYYLKCEPKDKWLKRFEVGF